MIRMVKDIEFFKDRELEDQETLEIFNVMTLATFPPYKTVIEYGETGDNFYFILTGECEIHLPDPKRLEFFKQAKRDVKYSEKELLECD